MGERRGGRQDKVVLGHRKRIKTEKEAKVVVFFGGGEFILENKMSVFLHNKGDTFGCG